MSNVEIPSEEEIKRFSTVYPNDPQIAKRIAIWEKIKAPTTKFFLPMEEDRGVIKFYLEPPREEEVWLFGISIAFLSQSELLHYIKVVADESRNGDLSTFHVWEGTLANLCKNIAIAASNRGIRVELHEVTHRGEIDLVDVLWDNLTT